MEHLMLREEVRRALAPRTLHQLSILESWDLEIIGVRAQTRKGWSATFTNLVEREYRRFISLVVINPTISYGMVGAVDDFWHEHILDTRDYLRMCEEVAGQIIHHVPTIRSNEDSATNPYRAFTLPDLARSFVDVPIDIWPSSESWDGCGGGSSCASCDKA